MTIKNLSLFLMLGLLVSSSSFATQEEVAGPVQPSVNRRALVCDQWQWIGNGAVTWGCLTVPREASVAEGYTTDQVISSLQDQINKLQAKLKDLQAQNQSPRD